MYETLKKKLITTSILYAIIGVILLIFPEKISDFMCYLIALVFIFFSVAGIVTYIKSENKTSYVNTTLIMAILLGAFGLFIMLNPRLFISFIPLVIGIFLITDSASKLSMSFDLKKMNYSKWWYMLISSFIILCVGILLVFNPFEAVEISIRIIGAAMLYNSISNILTIYSYSKVINKEERKILEAENVVIKEKTSK